MAYLHSHFIALPLPGFKPEYAAYEEDSIPMYHIVRIINKTIFKRGVLD